MTNIRFVRAGRGYRHQLTLLALALVACGDQAGQAHQPTLVTEAEPKRRDVKKNEN